MVINFKSVFTSFECNSLLIYTEYCMSISVSHAVSTREPYITPHFQQRNMRKLASIARRVFGNSVQASYFERFHWSILNFWKLQTAEHAIPCSVAVMLHGLWCPKIQNWPMKTLKITSLHRVQSVRTCCEYTNTRRDKEIRGAQLQIDNFK